MNEIFAIITLQKLGPNMTRTTTMSWILTPGPAVNRKNLLDHIMDSLLPEEWRGGVVLFYSAEPLRFAHQPAPEAAEATP